jgi:hypothetical protein
MIERMRGEPFGPHDSSWAYPRDDLANTTVAERTASSHELGTTRGTRPSGRCASTASDIRAESASSCTSDALPTSFGTGARVPAQICRQHDVHLLDAERGVGGRPSVSIVSPDAMLCTARITGWGMRVGGTVAFWKVVEMDARRAGSVYSTVLRERVQA